MNRKLTAAASVAMLVALSACTRSRNDAVDTTSAAGAYATPPAVVGATTGAIPGAVGTTTGATTTIKMDTARKTDTTKHDTAKKAP